jgi:uroporphyrinogen decarboxylase
MSVDNQPKALLRALEHERVQPPPIWLMRQAGRYLPEYRQVRAEAGSFLALCYDPRRAAEVTLQPIRRFGFDAAIIFSDILVVPQALGQPLTFVEGEGPRLEPLETVPLFDTVAFRQRLEPVYAAIAETKARLPRETALIGFAGAPWTLAGYMLDGEGHAFPRALAEMRGDSLRFGQLMDLLVEAVVEHLVAQVEAGAEAVQVFDSWAGLLDAQEAELVCLGPLLRIAAGFVGRCPGVPLILFPRNAPAAVLQAIAEDGRVAGLSLGTEVDPAWAAQQLQPRLTPQGNLDPLLLVEGGAALDAGIDRLVASFAAGPWIMNLGHGVVPQTPLEHVAQLVARIRG